MVRLQRKKQAAVTTGTSRDIRPFLREWFYGLYVISPGTGFLAPVRVMRSIIACATTRWRVAHGASTGTPGPHDFAVRIDVVRPRG
jgi:hypothetical protein